jgi:hypothetical protein
MAACAVSSRTCLRSLADIQGRSVPAAMTSCLLPAVIVTQALEQLADVSVDDSLGIGWLRD